MRDMSGSEGTLMPRLVLSMVVAACVAAVAVVVVAGDDDGRGGSSDGAEVVPVAEAELKLSTGGLNNSAAACPVVDVALIGSASIAFKGTVVVHEDGFAVLAVDVDYVGVGAPSVRLVAPPGVDAWLGPVSWTVGTQYLVTANSGVVNFCGRSGRATAELQDVFDQAFG
jgi:hypothetical protein